jgi:hypothetical protein
VKLSLWATVRSKFFPSISAVSPRRGELTSISQPHRERGSILSRRLGGFEPCDRGKFASDATPPGMKQRSRENARDWQGVGADEGFAVRFGRLTSRPQSCARRPGIRSKAGVRRPWVQRPPLCDDRRQLSVRPPSTRAGIKDWPCELAGSARERPLAEAWVALRAAFAQTHPVDPRKNEPTALPD